MFSFKIATGVETPCSQNKCTTRIMLKHHSPSTKLDVVMNLYHPNVQKTDSHTSISIKAHSCHTNTPLMQSHTHTPAHLHTHTHTHTYSLPTQLTQSGVHCSVVWCTQQHTVLHACCLSHSHSPVLLSKSICQVHGNHQLICACEGREGRGGERTEEEGKCI